MPIRFSTRLAFVVTATTAIVLAIAVPAYRRSTSPALTDRRGVIRQSNTIFPVVSMRVFASGPNSDRARILILYRRTTKPVNDAWEPKWLESGHAESGGITCLVNGYRIYPPDDSKLTVIYATDDDSPRNIRIEYDRYAELPWDDTALMWNRLVEGVPEDGG
jgi:hypothetical protein